MPNFLQPRTDHKLLLLITLDESSLYRSWELTAGNRPALLFMTDEQHTGLRDPRPMAIASMTLSSDELHIIRLVAENTRLQKELAVTKTCLKSMSLELGEVMEKLEELRKLL
jgi:hypothetical protein